MKVLVLSNGELKEREIENTLEELQGLVGGYIEVPFLGKRFRDNGIDVIINEEGKFAKELKPEIAIVGIENVVVDLLYGTCVFASHDEEGETIELNEKQKKIVMEELNDRVMLYDTNRCEEYLVKVLYIY